MFNGIFHSPEGPNRCSIDRPQVGATSRGNRQSATPPNNLTPLFSKMVAYIFSKFSRERAPPLMSPLRNSHDFLLFQKLSGSPDINFWLGGPDPQRGGQSPQLVGALGRDPRGTRDGERTAAISAAVAEKIAI